MVEDSVTTDTSHLIKLGPASVRIRVRVRVEVRVRITVRNTAWCS